MQKALFEQIGHQQQFLERQEAKEAQKEKEVTSKVRLPKLDILSYDGDKMRWVEFLDSFKCAVHGNKRVTNTDKFNYLKAKLHGGAAHAISRISLSNDT